jgi:hypothetical protein
MLSCGPTSHLVGSVRDVAQMDALRAAGDAVRISQGQHCHFDRK